MIPVNPYRREWNSGGLPKDRESPAGAARWPAEGAFDRFIDCQVRNCIAGS